jgi:hypothetical protein
VADDAVASPRKPLTIRRYRADDAEAIARFNQRMSSAANPHRLYAEPPQGEDESALPRERLFVATDGEEIRGGAFLRESTVNLPDGAATVGWVKYPLAESLIAKQYAGVPAALLLHLMREQPSLAAVGMGGHGGPFAQLLARLGWKGDIVPTLLAPLRLASVLRALPHVRQRATLRRLGALLRGSGAALALGAGYRSMLHVRAWWHLRSTTVTEFDRFDGWADRVWDRCAPEYPMINVRTSTALNWKYPVGTPGLHRLRIERGGQACGWATVQLFDGRGHADAPYGPLVLGVICDGLSMPHDATLVCHAAVRFLAARGADLLIANHSHPEWLRALKRAGLLAGPANFAFYRSRVLEQRLARNEGPTFVSRGDDGLIAV